MKASPNNAATTRQGRGQRKSAPKSSGGRKPQEQAAVKRVRAQAAAPELSSGAAAAPRGSKQATVIALLRRPEGVTVAEIVAATGWQPHTVRGAGGLFPQTATTRHKHWIEVSGTPGLTSTNLDGRSLLGGRFACRVMAKATREFEPSPRNQSRHEPTSASDYSGPLTA